jgi:hypothetical protein
LKAQRLLELVPQQHQPSLGSFATLDPAACCLAAIVALLPRVQLRRETREETREDTRRETRAKSSVSVGGLQCQTEGQTEVVALFSRGAVLPAAE